MQRSRIGRSVGAALVVLSLGGAAVACAVAEEVEGAPDGGRRDAGNTGPAPDTGTASPDPTSPGATDTGTTSAADTTSSGPKCTDCDPPNLCCAGECVYPSVDNCGKCGKTCDTARADNCPSTECKCGLDAPCTGDKNCCGGGCVDIKTDAANCGACGSACLSGESCKDGKCFCTVAGKVCDAGTSCCSKGCTDTSTDSANCGACGTACGTDQKCVGGKCTCLSCATGTTCCGVKCVDTMTDTANCGVCGKACTAGQTCKGGVCHCDPSAPITSCPKGKQCCGTDATCIDICNDEKNCGGCGLLCAGKIGTCFFGECWKDTPGGSGISACK